MTRMGITDPNAPKRYEPQQPPLEPHEDIKVEVVDGTSYYVPHWEGPFLEGLRLCGSVAQACRIAGICRTTAQTHRTYSPGFRKRWVDALDEARDDLWQEAWHRAKDGHDKPVFFQGQEVGTIKEYSDTLMVLLLKGTHPEVFKDRIEHSGPQVKPQIFLPEVIEEPPIEGEIIDDNPQ